MHLRHLIGIGTVVCKSVVTVSLLAVATVSANAATIPVSKADGVNFQFTAVDANGVLTVSFAPSSFITQINNNLVSPPMSATFSQMTLSPTHLTDDIPGLSGHFVPNLNSSKFGITSLTPPGAPNVVFDYSISFGQVSANGMTLTGVVALDPASATTFHQGADTYDFSSFQNFTTFTLSLGTQDQNPTMMYDVLKSGNGTFTGTSQFDFFTPVTPPVPDSGITASLFGFSLLGLGLLRRKMSC